MRKTTPLDSETEYIFGLLNSLHEDNSGRTELDDLISKHLPQWFIPMLNDKKRNTFYEKIIKKNVLNKTVLEIGTGIGMMSLLAAKHGAKHVYACEQNPLLYSIAKDNIERSPYAKKITLFFAHSDTLKLGVHIPKKVDIILSELISADIVSEEMLTSLEKAKSLLKKDGLYLPAVIKVFGCLIELKSKLPTELDSNLYTQSLKKIVKGKSQYVNLSRFPFKIASESIPLFSIENGFEVKPNFPLEICLTKTKKIKTKNTFFCLYFSMEDGNTKLLNLNLKENKNICHWDNFVREVDNKKTEYKFRLSNHDEQLYLVDIDS